MQTATAEKVREANVPAFAIDMATIYDLARDGVATADMPDYHASGSNSSHPVRADRAEAERRFRQRRDAANRAHYGEKIPANLRPATAEEAASIIAAWREGGPAKDSEARVTHDAGRLRDYLAKLDHEDQQKAAKERAYTQTRANDAAANYENQRGRLVAKIEAASEGEAFLDTLGKALAMHGQAEKARRDLQALLDRARESAADAGTPPPPMKAAPAAPLAAVRVMQVFHSFNPNDIGDGE